MFNFIRELLKPRMLNPAEKTAKLLAGVQVKKLVVGGGSIIHEADWISTDIEILDVTDADSWSRLLGKGKLSNVFAEHVWEHLTHEQSEAANKNVFNHLKPGGCFRIAVPDGYMPDPTYIDYVKPGGHGPGAEDHKILYNYITLRESLERVGFQVVMLEYWDENGKFHFNEWSTEQGKVLRSKRFDQRNVSGELKYTSLIIDAVKPNA